MSDASVPLQPVVALLRQVSGSRHSYAITDDRYFSQESKMDARTMATDDGTKMIRRQFSRLQIEKAACLTGDGRRF